MKVAAAAVPARVESPLPQSLPAGAVTTLFLSGSSVGDHELALIVDGRREPVLATAMPRPDLEPGRRGWWATPVVRARGAGDVIAIDGIVEGGEPFELARIAVAEPPRPLEWPRPTGAPLIAVCMATYEPDPGLLRTQVESLRAQTDRDWMCVVSDDGSSEASVASIEEVLGGDPRFVLTRSPERLGFYRNFERALALAPRHAAFVALCDQDDRWHPDKLETLRAAMGEAPLAYSDMRLVDAGGRLRRETFWHGRRNNSTNLASMLIANTVTGAAMLLRRDVVDLALPFPELGDMQYHDHWLAAVALASGSLAYVDRPLYDYVQHARAIFGDVAGGGEAVSRLRGPRAWVDGARAAYFCGYLPRAVAARTLRARCGDRMAPRHRRAIDRFVAAERSWPAFAWLALRRLRALAGRNETLGGERELVAGLVWRRLARLGAARDASFPDPPAFGQRGLRRWRSRL